MSVAEKQTKEVSWSKIKNIYSREFENYFNTTIGYVFLGIFSLSINFMFFFPGKFWEMNMATMDTFFSWLRILFLFFIPAVTMRLWAEEKKSGTVEILFTLPYSTWELILGKYFSALSFIAIALVTTLFIPFSIEMIGEPDWMLIIGGYLGVFLLAATYTALGLFISWLTQDQIVAFLFASALFFLLFIMGYADFLKLIKPFSAIVAYMSVSWHFESISRGIFDLRDIIYFISFSTLFLYLNYRSIEKRR
ncbi:MAG: ABC transporter permease subunit [Leptospirales bacterium]